jgi:tRNA threonylcarbamoyladenosine biosynthesis protein TsaE
VSDGTAAATIVVHAPEETTALAAWLGEALVAGDLLLLEGGLGAGKTAFVQGLARGLGLSAAVKSPTYTLVHEHRAALPGRPGLGHLDLYRMPEGRDLGDLGLDDLLARGAVAVEWGGRLAAREPDALLVAIEGPDPGAAPGRRRIAFTGRGVRARALVARVEAYAARTASP